MDLHLIKIFNFFQDGFIVCGGISDAWIPSPDCLQIQLGASDSKPKASMPEGRRAAVTTMISGNRFWVAGGTPDGGVDNIRDTSLIYDPHSDEWSWGPVMPYRSYFSCLTNMDKMSKKYLYAGGIHIDNGQFTALSFAYVYDWRTRVKKCRKSFVEYARISSMICTFFEAIHSNR